MGILFGLVNPLLLAAVALGLLCVIVWGHRMWWQRRPTRADRRARLGAPPARGAWRRLPLWVLVLGVPMVTAIGWALPLLSWSLLAFLVLDVAVAAARRLRARSAPVAAGQPPASR